MILFRIIYFSITFLCIKANMANVSFMFIQQPKTYHDIYSYCANSGGVLVMKGEQAFDEIKDAPEVPVSEEFWVGDLLYSDWIVPIDCKRVDFFSNLNYMNTSELKRCYENCMTYEYFAIKENYCTCSNSYIFQHTPYLYPCTRACEDFGLCGAFDSNPQYASVYQIHTAIDDNINFRVDSPSGYGDNYIECVAADCFSNDYLGVMCNAGLQKKGLCSNEEVTSESNTYLSTMISCANETQTYYSSTCHNTTNQYVWIGHMRFTSPDFEAKEYDDPSYLIKFQLVYRTSTQLAANCLEGHNIILTSKNTTFTSDLNNVCNNNFIAAGPIAIITMKSTAHSFDIVTEFTIKLMDITLPQVERDSCRSLLQIMYAKTDFLDYSESASCNSGSTIVTRQYNAENKQLDSGYQCESGALKRTVIGDKCGGMIPYLTVARGAKCTKSKMGSTFTVNCIPSTENTKLPYVCKTGSNQSPTNDDDGGSTTGIAGGVTGAVVAVVVVIIIVVIVNRRKRNKNQFASTNSNEESQDPKHGYAMANGVKYDHVYAETTDGYTETTDGYTETTDGYTEATDVYTEINDVYHPYQEILGNDGKGPTSMEYNRNLGNHGYEFPGNSNKDMNRQNKC